MRNPKLKLPMPSSSSRTQAQSDYNHRPQLGLRSLSVSLASLYSRPHLPLASAALGNDSCCCLWLVVTFSYSYPPPPPPTTPYKHHADEDVVGVEGVACGWRRSSGCWDCWQQLIVMFGMGCRKRAIQYNPQQHPPPPTNPQPQPQASQLCLWRGGGVGSSSSG